MLGVRRTAIVAVFVAASMGLAGQAEAQIAVPWPTAGTGQQAAQTAAGADWWTVLPAGQPGLDLLRAERFRDRLYELEFRTPLLPTVNTVRILVPPGYEAGAAERYPSMYLLHGCCNGVNPGGARNWTEAGDAEKLTIESGAIVVMPDGGAGGMYTDWVDGSRRYESYIVGQLLPWVDTHLRTVPRRESRGIAGLSMGGFGAMHLAARHPDLFSSVGTFSGVVDLLDPPITSSAFVEYLAGMEPGALPGGAFGPRASEIGWREHNPGDLGVNLRTLLPPLQEYGDPATDPIEDLAKSENEAMTDKLRAAGITPSIVKLPNEGHSYTVWNDGLVNYLKLAAPSWKSPVPAPEGFDYTAVTKEFSAYNYTVRVERPVREFATLTDVTASRFALTGSGTATVTTARRYTPGATYRTGASERKADGDGRLVVPVDLGPSALSDQLASADTGERPQRTETVVIVPLETAPPSACRRERTVTISLRTQVRAVQARVNGKRVGVRRIGRRTVRLTISGRPGTRVRVRIVARDRRGARFVQTKRFRVC